MHILTKLGTVLINVDTQYTDTAHICLSCPRLSLSVVHEYMHLLHSQISLIIQLTS